MPKTFTFNADSDPSGLPSERQKHLHCPAQIVIASAQLNDNMHDAGAAHGNAYGNSQQAKPALHA